MTVYPSIVAFTSCPATADDGTETLISGLWSVEDFYGIEPSAYVWSPYYMVVRCGDDSEDPECFAVDADVFESQVDPHAYGRRLEMERDMDFAEEAMV